MSLMDDLVLDLGANVFQTSWATLQSQLLLTHVIHKVNIWNINF